MNQPERLLPPLRLLVASMVLSASSAAQLGTNYCGATPNSSGVPASISATGELFLHLDDVTLACSSLPPGSWGSFLVGTAPGFVPGPRGSLGTLCLGGGIGVDRRPLVAGGQGTVAARLTLTALPGPMGSFAAVHGDRLHFQYWYRDVAAAPVSNFSDGLELVLHRGPGVPDMVEIQPGTFDMGSHGGSHPAVGPVHSVTLSRPFWVCAHEVTHAEWVALMVFSPHTPVGPDHPVEWVSWHDARTYCQRLTASQAALGLVPQGYEYRLPTEAEWEYVCRAGTTSEYSVGDALLCGAARIRLDDAGALCPGFTTTAPVASFPPNPWGLHDLHGNVWEWCLDGLAPYASEAVTDPFVPALGSERVLRGGSRASWAPNCRSAHRDGQDELVAYQDVGFRVVLGPAIAP